MADIRQAFEYAAQNPNSDFAKNLSELAKSGALDIEARKNGIDLTPFKPVQEKTTLQKVANASKALVGGIASGVGGAVLTAEDYLARKAVNTLPEGATIAGVSKEQMQQNLANAPKLQEQLKQQFGGNESPVAFGAGELGGQIATLAAPASAAGRTVGTATTQALGAGKKAQLAEIGRASCRERV